MSDLFTAENSAMLLIDHQVGTMQWIKTLPLEVVKRHTLALAKTAHILHIPVVLLLDRELQSVLAGRVLARHFEFVAQVFFE